MRWALAVLFIAAAVGLSLAAQQSNNWRDRDSAVEESKKIKGWLDAKRNADLGSYFDRYALEHGKKYSNTERGNRFKVWAKEMERIVNINLDPTSTWVAAPNSFTDLTDEEKAQLTGLKRIQTADGGNPAISGGTSPIAAGQLLVEPPSAVDWKAAGKVSPVKNQGQCGSCWAFATLAAVESQYLIQYNKALDLSEQQLVDCSGAGSCRGGWPDYAISYIQRLFVTTEARYPYRQKSRGCMTKELAATPTYERASITAPAYTRVESMSKTALMLAVAQQPVINTFTVASDFYSYKSGVYNGVCGDNTNHAVLLVGYNSTAEGGYFLLKNSWGSSWGDGGFFKIKILEDGNGKCGMYLVNWVPGKAKQLS